MTFEEIVDQALAILQRRGRVAYRTLKRQFTLDEDALEDLKAELIDAQRVAADEDGNVLVWTGSAASPPTPATAPARAPRTYTPPYLAEKILTSRGALEGERKQVTVLFADLKGSMELLADRDPEEARQLLDPVLECLMAAVHRFEGTVNQVMGDGIMALFGAPLAHEDHAVRACYAALHMQEAIGRYAEALRRQQGLDVQIRVGLNCGAVVVRAIGNDLQMDYTAVGQTTHLAARMEQLARPGTALLTADTLRLVEGYVEVKPLGPVPVKGLPEPVEVYELLRAGPVRSRLQAAVARGLTRFVGRDTELEQLRQALARGGAGQGQVVAGVGEAGVGKSRLLYEFTRSHHTHGWLLLASHSVSYGKATAYLPVLDLLKGYFQISPQDDARRQREKVTGKLLTLDRTLEPMLPALLALLEVPVDDQQWQAFDPPQRRQRTLDAVKRLLLRESQVQPLCLVCEDLHWIDAETQALLDGLVESLPTARLLLLVNYRPEYQHGWGRKTYYTQLRLDPLPPASADEFLQALLGSDPSLEPLKPLLIARTQGNPFFLEESVRTLVETGVLVGERGANRLARPLWVAAYLTDCFGVTGDPARAVEAGRRALALAGTLGDAALQVVTHIFLGRTYYGLGDYPRAIALLRQNVASLDGALLHERFGLPGLPAVLSRGLLARCLAELGAFTEGLARGEESLRIAETVDHPHSLIDACYSIGRVSLHKGAWPQAIPWLERGLEICRVWDMPLQLYLVSATLGYAYVLAGQVSDALPLLEPSASTEGMEIMRGRVHVWLSEAYLRLRRLDEALAVAGRGLEFCRAYAQQGEQAWALRLLGEIHAHRQPPQAELAEAAYREALALAEALGMRPLQAHCHLGLGRLYGHTGHAAQARAALSAAIEWYHAMDMTFWLPQAKAALAEVEGH